MRVEYVFWASEQIIFKIELQKKVLVCGVLF